MIKIGKLADYALLITDYLISTSDTLCTNEDVSQATHLPLSTVRKLLKKLVDARIVISYRGVNGGYRLSGSPEDISIAQVIIAVEGPIAVTQCASTREVCSYAGECNLKENWGVINKFFIDTLSSISLAAMSRTISSNILEFRPHSTR